MVPYAILIRPFRWNVALSETLHTVSERHSPPFKRLPRVDRIGWVNGVEGRRAGGWASIGFLLERMRFLRQPRVSE
jgi:hypothetical protein